MGEIGVANAVFQITGERLPMTRGPAEENPGLSAENQNPPRSARTRWVFCCRTALQSCVRHVYVSVCGGRQMDDKTRTELEAAVYRRLVEHLRARTDVQNIDMMNLAGFCRNCLSNWMKEAADAQGISMSKDESREVVYGMPYDEWRKKYQKEASSEQKAAFEKSRSGH
jgi:hypothetical protein